MGRNTNRRNDHYVMINPLHLKPVLKPIHSCIERTRDSGRTRVLGQKYALIRIKSITRQVRLIQYSANAVAYKVIIFFNDNIQSTARDIEACKMTYSFHSLYHISTLVNQTLYQYLL
jgi:hypothetical protein